MKTSRRNFLVQTGIATGGLPACSGARSAAAATATATPKLGTQEPSSEENFRRFQRYGVTHVCG